MEYYHQYQIKFYIYIFKHLYLWTIKTPIKKIIYFLIFRVISYVFFTHLLSWLITFKYIFRFLITNIIIIINIIYLNINILIY